MLSVLMLSLLIPVTDVAGFPMTALSQQGDPPVKLWLDKDRVQLGDRMRVDVRTEADGYLLVLHAEPDGRVRVLFPLDPIHDNFVRGGDEFELRGRGDRETFRIYSSEGVGTVYAAFSRDPFHFEEYVRGDHWDYGARDVWYVAEDPEPEITDLVLSLASGAYFDYDFVQYAAGDAVVAARQRSSLSLYAAPYYYDSFNVGINVGGYYDPLWSYRSYWHMGFVGWPSRFYVRSACYRWGGWNCYDPWYYGSWYDPWYGGYGYGYGWGYGYGYGYGYDGYYPRYIYRNPITVVYGDDRLRTTSRTRLQPANGTTRGRRVFAGALGSSVRRTSAASSISPAARRLAASSVTDSRAPQRATATTTAGRRTIDSPRTTPDQRVTTAGGRRTVEGTPRSVNATEQQPARRVTGQGATTRQATPARTTATTRRPTTPRQTTPTRETTVTTRPSTPTRTITSRPETTRSTPSRVTTSRPATSRSTPSRVTTSRPATTRSAPSRVTTSRPETTRSTPSRVTTSRPATSRSTPSQATPSRPVTTRSAPARTSGSSASRPTTTSTTRKPATTTSGTRRKP